MKRLSVVVLILTLMSSFSFAQQKYLGWSLGYYTTWDNSYTPATIPWDAFTHVAYFQALPNWNKNNNTSDGGLNVPNETVAKQLIAEGHKRGKKVMFCVGGAGVGDGFKYACANSVRGKFISNIVQYCKRLGYDGFDTDWEENFDNTLFVAWHKELRDSINKMTPVPIMTIAAEDWFDVTLTVSAYVDQVNDMYYSASADYYKNTLFPKMTRAGVPKLKCGAGMGISMNNSVAMDTAICRMVIDNGYGGIIQWAITKNNNGTPNMTAIAKYVNPAVTSVFARSQAQYDSPVSLFVDNSGMPGMNQIRYTLPGDYSGVDLTIYDLRGAVVKTLVHGPSSQGSYSVPFKRVGAGEYVVRLTTSSGVQAARSMLIK
jgi:hypothetical protein